MYRPKTDRQDLEYKNRTRRGNGFLFKIILTLVYTDPNVLERIYEKCFDGYEIIGYLTPLIHS
jgi:hypothetical protein